MVNIIINTTNMREGGQNIESHDNKNAAMADIFRFYTLGIHPHLGITHRHMCAWPIFRVKFKSSRKRQSIPEAAPCQHDGGECGI